MTAPDVHETNREETTMTDTYNLPTTVADEIRAGRLIIEHCNGDSVVIRPRNVPEIVGVWSIQDARWAR